MHRQYFTHSRDRLWLPGTHNLLGEKTQSQITDLEQTVSPAVGVRARVLNKGISSQGVKISYGGLRKWYISQWFVILQKVHSA